MKSEPSGGNGKTPGDSADERRGAQTVHRAFDILETFTIQRPSLSLAEISDAVRLTVPTTHRLLKALQSEDMIYWDSGSRRYSLGPGVMRLAGVVLNRDDLVRVAQPGLEQLRSLTTETVGLHWLIGEERVCLVELASPLPIKMTSGVGRAYPIHAGAAGKVILAAMPDRQARTLLESAIRTKRISPARRQALLDELPAIRRMGYATSQGETVPGAAAVAMALLNSAGAVVAAINITGPADRLTSAKMREASESLRAVGSHIMRQLGGPGGEKAPKDATD